MTAGNRRRVRFGSLIALGVLSLAACGGSGGGPSIDTDVAERLARQADAVADAGRPCAARDRARTLQQQTIDAINAGRIPAEYQEALLSRVSEILSEFEIRCLPTPAPSSPEPAPAVVAPAGDEKHGHKQKHGKHGDRGKEDEGD